MNSAAYFYAAKTVVVRFQSRTIIGPKTVVATLIRAFFSETFDITKQRFKQQGCKKLWSMPKIQSKSRREEKI
ncbi:hypothetical protein SAMN05428947_101508 [Mucilaginibacter sp. OK283]|jgi:hypothetical protein|nr:hypothetical protein SAMN05428947_101508 [Mucilaginibacter sp. OK283]